MAHMHGPPKSMLFNKLEKQGLSVNACDEFERQDKLIKHKNIICRHMEASFFLIAHNDKRHWIPCSLDLFLLLKL